MSVLLNNQMMIVRSINETDSGDIFKLLESSWRIYIRIAWHNLRHKLEIMPGFLAEDRVGLRGFIMIEPQTPELALIVAAGLRDTWSVRPFLNVLLPKLEQTAQNQRLSALMYVGYEAWLIDALQQCRFEPREWIVMFERCGNDPPLPITSGPARLRTAHRNDLSALLMLDTLAFEQLWRKSFGYFTEALAHAGSFVVAEIGGHIVGYVWCEIHQQQAHLTRLAVHPYYQGRGVGSQLLHQAITDMMTQDVRSMTLNTQETNHRSQALYARFGFVNTMQRVPVLWKDI